MEILHNTHQLDDSADKILINLRLKDKALKCFQSKPSHFGMSATELLEAMKGMFDHRPNKLALVGRWKPERGRQTKPFATIILKS